MSTVSFSLHRVAAFVFRAVSSLSPFRAVCMQGLRQLSCLTREVLSTCLHNLHDFIGDKFRVSRWNRFGQFVDLHPVYPHCLKTPRLGKNNTNGLASGSLWLRVVAFLLCDVPDLGTVYAERLRRMTAIPWGRELAVRFKVPMAPQLKPVGLQVEHATAEHYGIFKGRTEHVFYHVRKPTSLQHSPNWRDKIGMLSGVGHRLQRAIVLARGACPYKIGYPESSVE